MGDAQRAVKQLLQDLQFAGLTHLPRPSPLVLDEMENFEEQSPLPSVPVSQVHQPVASAENAAQSPAGPMVNVPTANAPSSDMMSSETMASESSSHAGLSLIESKTEQLKQVSQCVAGCQRCPELARTRTQTVFGVGSPLARVMFIGEAPGEQEDLKGEPFVGPAGQLLTKIIEACGWRREEIYICNILRCRPPGNRLPSEDEANNCREYLDQQIRIVNPEFIVCWGGCAAQNLLKTDETIGKLRQRFFQYNNAKVLCTYHPSYLLRNPAAKKPVWDDMKKLMAEMGVKPPQS